MKRLAEYQRKFYQSSLLFMFLFMHHSAFASACTNLFPDAVQSNAVGSSIVFICGSKLINNPDTVLSTGTITGPGSCATHTCSAVTDCTASGTPVGQLSPGLFQTDSSATNVTVAANTTQTIGTGGVTDTDRNNVTLNAGAVATPTTLNFSDHTSAGTNVYRMQTLAVNQNSVINFQPGDYWINTLNVSGIGNHTFNVVGTTGTARLFINNAPNITRQISWNTASAASNPAKQLLIYSYGNFTLNQTASRIIGALYAVGAVALTGGGNAAGDIQGAVTGTNVTLNGSTTIQYDGTAIDNLDFGGLCPPAGTADHFLMIGPTSNPKCVPTNITVIAKSGNTTVTNYTGDITLNTDTGQGTWSVVSGAGTFSQPSPGNGIATYTYAVADQGTAIFQLNNSAGTAGAITVQAIATFNSLLRGITSISLQNTNFLMSAAVPPPNTSFKTTQIAGNNPVFNIVISSVGGASCLPVGGYNGGKIVKFWFNYLDPITGTAAVNINGVNLTTSQATAVNQNITFTSGSATLAVYYRDVGMLSINAMEVSGARTGATDAFIVKPDHFTISGTGIPGTISAAGTVFKKAGQVFTANVDVQGNDNINTPNYGNETTPQGILVSSQAPMPLPAGGHNGSTGTGAIGNGSSFTATATPGQFQATTLTFDEVGSINMIASVASGSYLEGGDAPNHPAVVVGRFTPDHFDVAGNVPQFSTGCNSSGFTYLDQPFSYSTQPVMTITAKALGATITQNYTGTLWKLTSGGFGTVYNKAYFPPLGGGTIPALVLNATAGTPAFVDGGNGTGAFTFSGSGFKIQRLSGTVSPPLLAEIQLNIPTITDSDSVPCTGTGCVSGGFAFGNTTLGNGIAFAPVAGSNPKTFYHGRIMVMDALGSELLPLTIPLQTQAYIVNTSGSSGGFAPLSESCTSLSSAANLIVTPSAGLSTTASFASGTTFAAGVLNATLSAPNVSGYADVEANLAAGGANVPWLQYNWPYQTPLGTTFIDNPRGRGTFGLFKGNDRIIYQKELYQ